MGKKVGALPPSDEVLESAARLGDTQFLRNFLDSHKACVFHFITPLVWL